jgi:hypothetical protein
MFEDPISQARLYICGGDNPMPRFYHFSTRADYEQLAAAHELFASLYFVRGGFFETEEVPYIHGLLSLPDLGHIKHALWHSGPIYWVSPEEPKQGVRRLPDWKGKKRFDLDTSTLPVALQFQPNGIWEKNILICGHLEATNPRGDTRALYKKIAKCFAKEYQKGKYYHCITYVGRDALALRKKRYRLCANPNLTRTDDFKVETLVN